MLFYRILQCVNPAVAVDLGTANTLVHVRGKGVVVNEPSCIAMQEGEDNSSKVLAVGREAKIMTGRTPEHVRTIRPIRDGAIADFKATEEMVRRLIERGVTTNSVIRPVVGVCVPSAITEVERRAVIESLERAGARKIYLFPEPLAAAVGAGLPVGEATGSMVVDIGGGTTEVAVLSLNGLVYSESIRVAGDKLDESIINYVKRTHNLLIGEQTAETVKLSIGAARSKRNDRKLEVRGRDAISAMPKRKELTEGEIADAITEPVREIIQLIKRVIENTPPELVGDVADRGITLTGGGALLKDLDAAISDQTGLPVNVAQDPLTCCVTGTGAILGNLEAFSENVTH